MLEISESIKIITRKSKPIGCVLWLMLVELVKVLQALDHVTGGIQNIRRHEQKLFKLGDDMLFERSNEGIILF